MRVSSWRNEPAAAFLGFANVFLCSSSFFWFSAKKSAFDINTSPRTSKTSGASLFKNRGKPRIAFKFSVMSSPILPSPRVDPRVKIPLTYKAEKDKPSILGSEVKMMSSLLFKKRLMLIIKSLSSSSLKISARESIGTLNSTFLNSLLTIAPTRLDGLSLRISAGNFASKALFRRRSLS